MKYIIIYNPRAANNKNVRLIKRIKANFADNEHIDFAVFATKHRGHAEKIAREAAETFGPEAVVIVCGGDGTASEVSNGLAGTKTPMMVIPCGSGNDFAKKLYPKNFTAKSVAKSFGLLSESPKYSCKPIDLMKVNERYSINVTSIGFDTQVETVGRKLIEKFGFLGKLGYKIAVLLCLFKDKHYCVRIMAKKNSSVARIPRKLGFTLLAVCNASYYGGGFCPAPNARLDDGVLNLVYADPVCAANVIRLAPSYIKGTALKHREIHACEVTSLKIASANGEKIVYNSEGENFSAENVNINVVKGCVKLCFPL